MLEVIELAEKEDHLEDEVEAFIQTTHISDPI